MDTRPLNNRAWFLVAPVVLLVAFSVAGLSEIDAYRAAMAVFLACSASAYGYFLLAKSHNALQQAST